MKKSGVRGGYVGDRQSAHTYTAEWRTRPEPSLGSSRRLTFEDGYNYPHSWIADSQSVIFESDRDGRLEIFQQNRTRREPDLLAASERQNYLPQLTPDGKWILFMSAKSTRDAGFTDLRLMRVPANGGPIRRCRSASRWMNFDVVSPVRVTSVCCAPRTMVGKLTMNSILKRERDGKWGKPASRCQVWAAGRYLPTARK